VDFTFTMGTNDTMNVLYLPRLFHPQTPNPRTQELQHFIFQGGEEAALGPEWE